jgi:hypothetical protein
MRLSDAGGRRRQTKALYPNHRLPPWLNEDATRDRSNRLLGALTRATSNYAVSNYRVHNDAQRKTRYKSNVIKRSALTNGAAHNASLDPDARRRRLQ